MNQSVTRVGSFTPEGFGGGVAEQGAVVPERFAQIDKGAAAGLSEIAITSYDVDGALPPGSFTTNV
jgi:hypothetical protein